MGEIAQVTTESKMEQARRALLGLIRARGPGIKLPTIQEMCVLFQVSRTPLEQALQSLESRGLLRRRRGSGIYVAETAGQKTVGVVFGGNIFSSGYSPFWLLLLQAVREQAGGCGFRPRVYLDISEGADGLGGHAQLVEDLEERRLDGLLLLAPHHDDEAAQLRAHGVPLVVFGGTDGADWRVLHDVASFIRLAARELAAAGARRVALMGHGVRPLLSRFAEELRQAGIAEAQVEDWTYETWATRIPEVGTHEHCAYLLTRQQAAAATDRHPLPDSLVSLEDTMTRGTIVALREVGLRPGGELRIVTAANRGSPVLRPHAAELIQIEYDPAASVRAALAMLGTLMSGDVPPQNPVLIAPHSTR